MEIKEFFEIEKLCKELGITTIGQLMAVKNNGENLLNELYTIRNKRTIYLADRKFNKNLDKLKNLTTKFDLYAFQPTRE